MSSPLFLKDQVQNLLDLARDFLAGREQKMDSFALNEIVRNLRISIQSMLTNHFLHFDPKEGEDFCHAIHDQLLGTCNHYGSDDPEYSRYFVQSLMLSFEWAQQIKHEVDNDPATQQILLVDIPILRPFHYGAKETPVVPAPKRGPD